MEGNFAATNATTLKYLRFKGKFYREISSSVSVIIAELKQ